MKKYLRFFASFLFLVLFNIEAKAIDGVDINSNALYNASLGFQGGHMEFRHYGYYGVVNGALGYSPDLKILTTGVEVINGFQFNRYTGFGIGVGFVTEKTKLYSHIPIFLELRSHLNSNRFCPFTSAFAGYTIPVGIKSSYPNQVSVTKGGANFGLSIGFRYAIKPTIGINFFIGYQGHLYTINEHHFIMNESSGINKYTTEDVNIYSQIKLGFGFNF